MKHFLLIYNRTLGELVEAPNGFDDAYEAMRARNARELAEIAHPEIEVVVLSAENLDALMLTHSRYFMSASALIRAAS